jgi:hypothetical protein
LRASGAAFAHERIHFEVAKRKVRQSPVQLQLGARAAASGTGGGQFITARDILRAVSSWSKA